MKNKGIIIFLIILAVIIIAVIATDFISKRPDNMEPNQFEYTVDEFKNVPEELIHYKETKNFKIGFDEPKGLTVSGDKIYLVGDQKLKVIDTSGKLLNEISLINKPNTVEVSDDKVFVAFEKQIHVFNSEFEVQDDWPLMNEKTFITAVAVFNGNVFVADAGTRKILRFSEDGKKLGEFDGKNGDEEAYGFIVPSPYFDIDINEDGDLWIVNPGLHSFENFTYDGNFRSNWQNTNMKIEGFSGCCNPAHYTFLPDGSFVTAEKGLVRIKVYKPSGEFSGVVAAPNKFDDKPEGHAPDVATDNQGNIYALDFDRKILRVFESK
ncbi:MAG: hypothetical protein ABFS16_15680 [Bacteroidota bacterium]